MKSEKKLKSFQAYCKRHPEERFWQALRNWAGYSFIFGSHGDDFDDTDNLVDTFYIEDSTPVNVPERARTSQVIETQ